MYDAVIYSN